MAEPTPVPPPDNDDGTPFANVREFLGFLIGQTLVDITQHDRDEWVESRAAYVVLHFAGGGTITIPVTEAGFDYFDPGDDDGPATLGVKGLGSDA